MAQLSLMKLHTQDLKESYIGTLQEYGIPRNTSVDLLTDRFTGLIEGEVSAREFAQRVDATFQGIQENIPEVQSFYRENFGLDLTPEAIFVGALDPTVGEEIVAGRITTAQIGGEAARAGFPVLQAIWHKDYKELVLHKHKQDKSLQVLNYNYHSYKNYKHNKVLLKNRDSD